ncbi:LysR family substrate-binding domain-containing protein [Sinomonas susongensis]|uniref:LysR family substrate-binding domain-containing protein n=1 Tax=Sinomonas susongensis TaxID=1324851 RepID=UPI00110848E5|nr:LysR family substrate-binding domain-containing protein [Sinomonas susongensis]
MDSQHVPAALRVAFVAGVAPGKWFRRWEERFPETALQSQLVDDGRQLDALRAGEVDLAFVRLPVDREGLHLIPLYEELPVVVAPKGHEIQAFDEVPFAEIEDELFEYDGGPSERLDLVEGGAGLAILPMSVVRHLNRPELRYRPVVGVPGYEVGLAWLRENESDAVQEFVGIVRGRSANSSRQTSVQREEQEAARQRRSDRAAAQSAAAKARNEASRVGRKTGAGKAGTGNSRGARSSGKSAGAKGRHPGAGRRRPR